jgi:hypothetical protein
LIEVNNVSVESLNIEYLRVHIEDHDEAQIRRSFPLVYRFIQDAFEEKQDFFKNPSK